MRYSSFSNFLQEAKQTLAKGPVALIAAEDQVEVNSTLRHHLDIGFKRVILLAKDDIVVPQDLEDKISRITVPDLVGAGLPSYVNQLNAAAPNIWLYYCFNAEYLFFPFMESRSVGEMLDFHTEERREAMLSYVIDLYAENLTDHPNAVSLDTAHFDGTGYFATPRENPDENWAVKDRQVDCFGGLRLRFEEFVPWARRKIDRTAIFRTKPGLTLREDFTLSDEEMNTYACPWHNNLTSAIVSFRTAKALRSNPGSRFAINTFLWRNSQPFDWQSQQLMNLGLMEPGQWF
jgi:hypothetical protein